MYSYLTDRELIRYSYTLPYINNLERELVRRLDIATDEIEALRRRLPYGDDTRRTSEGGGEAASERQGNLALLPRE